MKINNLILFIIIGMTPATALAQSIGVYQVDPWTGMPVQPQQQWPSFMDQVNRNHQTVMNGYLMMEQAALLRAQRQQMYQQQQVQQRQYVAMWQKFLTEQGYTPGPIDGVWGPRTAQAYQEYLEAN